MSNAPLPIDERDLQFVLFDHLRVHELLSRDAYPDMGKEDAELILKEGWRFAREQVWPTSVIGDREGCRFQDGKVTVPACFHEVYKGYSEGGWAALTASEQYGGSGLPTSLGIAVGEVMVSANISFSPYPGLSRGVARVLENFGTPWMKEHVVPRLYRGEWAGTMCLTEPHAGTAVGDLKTTATPAGDRYRIKGNKIFITGGDQDLTDNIVHLVLARIAGAPDGIKGVSLFLVSKKKLGTDGQVSTEGNDAFCTGIEEKMGLHGSATCQMAFGEEGTCEGYLVGEANKGIVAMFQLMNEARIGTGLHGLAAASVAWQTALGYAKERVQGVEIQNMKDVAAPRVTILSHPDVKRMAFTMKAQVEGLRALLFKTAWLADQSRTHPDEGERDRAHQLVELLTPLCKSHGSDVGHEVCITAIQTLGGAGYTRDYVVEQMARDVKVASIYEGANGIQALDLIGRKLSARHGASFQLLMDTVGATLEANLDHPVLGDVAKAIQEAQALVRQVTGTIASRGLSGDVRGAALYASPYLTLLSHLITSWLLLEQAVIAHDKLSGLLLDEGIQDERARAAFLDQRDDARYLENKVATARFYATSLLPANLGLAAQIETGDQSILDAAL